MVIGKCLIGLLLLYTSQNLLGTIFRVTFTVFYRRIRSIVGKYSILCCDNYQEISILVFSSAITCRLDHYYQHGSVIDIVVFPNNLGWFTKSYPPNQDVSPEFSIVGLTY
jgi:hypothetical protein